MIKDNNIELSDYAKFTIKWRGYEFHKSGQVFQKCAIFCNIKKGKHPENNGIKVRQKPGWYDGRCLDLPAYETYLSNLKF